ncbi:uncharacterized protein RHOBADRAFT_54724 [Rhodotorula graminis WP1]|uniref:FAD-binding FR-type domain-containing protein n=1 Tax=Rhodotorula graminis (strain WP1) TaxID=578459 RepID=A0A0P9F1M0_RHOGW|nr:uncharacterized protein RHOBADRAFT_54724 [Rhodotorula graminis WP1]KPV73505.1 hypothetical protein RHOBADRAFT_54724 [Rhodotorula graminis WP1]
MSVCYDSIGIPVPCAGWNVYDSYVTDPRYQRYFTIAWTSAFAVAFIVNAPALVRTLATGDWRRALGSSAGLFGVHEGHARRGYVPLGRDDKKRPEPHSSTSGLARRPYLALAAVVRSASLLTLPLPAFFARLSSRTTPSCHPTRTYAPFSLGRLAVALLIPAFLVATLLPESQLRANPNRFGFLAIACIPLVFVLSAKNGPASWLLGRGWTAVNFLHRWLARAIVLLVLLHFYFWTIQYSGAAQTAFLAGEKERRGIAALAFLLLLTLSSLPPMRRFSYPVFFTLHHCGLVGFLVFLHRHTVYARAYSTWPVVAIYTLDVLGRLLSLRVRVAECDALEGGMTRVALPGLRAGWRGGQHLSVRLFFVPPPLEHAPGTSRTRRLVRDAAHALRCAVRPFEAHPLSIASAPAGLAADEGERGVELYARSCGPRTWSDDLHRHVAASSALAATAKAVGRSAASPQQQRVEAQRSASSVRMLCLIEGPYGGLPAYSSPVGLLEQTESLVLVAGGSGMSFVLGVLDELVGRRLRAKGGARGGRVDVVWVVRQRAHVAWFAERLRAVLAAAEGSPLRVVLKVYVTCDDALATAVDASAPAPSSSPSSSSSAGAAAPPPPPPLLPELATLSYSRPSLRTLVHDALDRALAPCGTCYPVCRCGELAGAGGECANDEEECVGGCGGVASARELLDRREGEEEKGEGGEEKEERRGEVVPTLARQGGCCGSQSAASRARDATAVDEIVELPSAVPSSCCGPSSSTSFPPARAPPSCGCCCARTTGGGCCTGVTEGPASAADVDADERDRVEGRPLRVRTGGMGFVVCGPGNMVAELRNAVATIPLAKQARVGGITVHVEQYSV